MVDVRWGFIRKSGNVKKGISNTGRYLEDVLDSFVQTMPVLSKIVNEKDFPQLYKGKRDDRITVISIIKKISLLEVSGRFRN